MLEYNGHYLLAYCYDRVKRRHRILENGSNPAAADPLPVVCVLDLCAVYYGIAVKLLLFLIKGAELHAECCDLKYLVKNFRAAKVLAYAHGGLKGLV